MGLMLRRILAALLLALAAVPAAAQTAEERTRLDWALERGRLLFEIDRAAWVTTDDLREHVADPGAAGIRGWTVEPEGGGYVVTYYAGEGDARAAVYRGRVENRRVVSREVFAEGARPPLTPPQRRLADARDAVRRMDLRACVRSAFNAAVIPPAAPDAPIDVYALTPQIRTGEFPFGGHFRATLSAEGEILAQRAFTNSCLTMSDRLPAGAEGEAVGLSVTHLLDPIPTEIHVFLSIWMGLPLYVGAGDRVWEVTGERIAFVADMGAEPSRRPPDRKE